MLTCASRCVIFSGAWFDTVETAAPFMSRPPLLPGGPTRCDLYVGIAPDKGLAVGTLEVGVDVSARVVYVDFTDSLHSVLSSRSLSGIPACTHGTFDWRLWLQKARYIQRRVANSATVPAQQRSKNYCQTRSSSDRALIWSGS